MVKSTLEHLGKLLNSFHMAIDLYPNIWSCWDTELQRVQANRCQFQTKRRSLFFLENMYINYRNVWNETLTIYNLTTIAQIIKISKGLLQFPKSILNCSDEITSVSIKNYSQLIQILSTKTTLKNWPNFAWNGQKNFALSGSLFSACLECFVIFVLSRHNSVTIFIKCYSPILLCFILCLNKVSS